MLLINKLKDSAGFSAIEKDISEEKVEVDMLIIENSTDDDFF